MLSACSLRVEERLVLRPALRVSLWRRRAGFLLALALGVSVPLSAGWPGPSLLVLPPGFQTQRVQPEQPHSIREPRVQELPMRPGPEFQARSLWPLVLRPVRASWVPVPVPEERRVRPPPGPPHLTREPWWLREPLRQEPQGLEQRAAPALQSLVLPGLALRRVRGSQAGWVAPRRNSAARQRLAVPGLSSYPVRSISVPTPRAPRLEPGCHRRGRKPDPQKWPPHSP